MSDTVGMSVPGFLGGKYSSASALISVSLEARGFPSYPKGQKLRLVQE